MPPAISGIDAKTVRHRIVDVAVKPLPSVIADRIPRTVAHRPSKWLAARVMLVLLLASMPILGISVDVFGLVSQSTTSIVVIALCAVLGAIITFAPHRIDMIVGRGLIAGMVACIVYDGARLFAVHVLGLMGDFIPVMGSWVTGEPDTAGSAAVGYVWRYIGDGGGLGVAFFVVAFALGIDRWSNVRGGARRSGLRRLPHVDRADRNGRAGSARSGDDVPPQHGHDLDHPDRAPDLRLRARPRLPEGTARRGPSRMALAPAPGISPGSSVPGARARDVASVTNPIAPPQKGTIMSTKITHKKSPSK